MKRGIAAALAAAALVASIMFATPALAAPLCGTQGNMTVCLTLEEPDGTAINCGSSVSGVGEIVMNGYVTNTGAQTVQFKTAYDAQTGGGDWYIRQTSQTISGTVDIIQVVQDLAPGQNGQTVQFAFARVAGAQTGACVVTVNSIPAPDGDVSTRTAHTDDVDQLAIQLRDYATGVPFACNADSPGGRINASLRARNTSAGLFDLHVHEERQAPLGTGPDQDAMYDDQRWWEAALFRVAVTTTLAEVANLTSQLVSSGGIDGPNTVHWGQQDLGGGDNEIDPETMCHFDI